MACSSAISSSLAQAAAFAAQRPSSTSRHSLIAIASATGTIRTRALLLGSRSTSPSAARSRSAARTLDRLTPNISARSGSISRWPATSSPWRMARRTPSIAYCLADSPEGLFPCITGSLSWPGHAKRWTADGRGRDSGRRGARPQPDRRAESVSYREDRLQIRDLIENWVVYRDSGDWARFTSVWHDGARMNATWFQGPYQDFIEASRKGAAEGVRISHF